MIPRARRERGAARRAGRHAGRARFDRNEYCAFGQGDRDLTAVLQALLDGGYGGDFTVEYKGRGDGTLQLYESVKRARLRIRALG
jgi:sugar phosphate isomerase/epimerase